jgi:hypothetical protein
MTRIPETGQTLWSGLGFADVVWQATSVTRLYIRGLVFDCTYNAGIWEYENEIPGHMTSNAFYGEGGRFYIYMVHEAVKSRLALHMKAGVTRYFRQSSVPSSLSSEVNVIEPDSTAAADILGDTRLDLRAQIVAKF